MAATMDKRRYIQEDVCWRAFKTFDVDGSGTIDKEELMKLLGVDGISDVMQVKVTEKEVDSIMQEVDLNGDGKIDFEEFLTMMRKMPKDQRCHSMKRRSLRNRTNSGLVQKPQVPINIGIGCQCES